MDFVSFHTHTTYSYADGIGHPTEHVQRVAELGMGALGIAEHGNVNSHPELERAGLEHGIKTHYGVEAYFSPPATRQKFHLTLVAMNAEGYHNLSKLVTQSYYDFYQWPTVTWEWLRKYNEGIAVLSGCADGLLSCTLLGGKSLGEYRDEIPESAWTDTDRRIRRFHEIFGDRFYLEVQRIPGYNRTRLLNPAFEELSRKHSIPLIATADVHYLHGYQNRLQAELHQARWSSAPEQIVEASWEHSANLTYPLSDEELISDLVGTGLEHSSATAALRATKSLSDRCDVVLPKAKPLRFKTSREGRTSAQELVLWIRRGLDKRMAERPDISGRLAEYKKRIEFEYKVILDKDFCDYFLATAELVQWAKQHKDETIGEKDGWFNPGGIDVGPGRGSAAGSLICYALAITEIDPLHPTFSRMVFERFIDPTRSDMPDIDLDFDDIQRPKVGKKARDIYGPENVCNVANHTKYRGKLALANIASAYNLPRTFFDEIGKRCAVRVETDDRRDDSILDVVEAYGSHPKIAPLLAVHGDKIKQAIELEGNEHSMGVHAGGYIISSEPITSVCAIYTKEKGSGSKREMAQVIPYEKRDAESLGMLKMDFLGLSTMGQQNLIRRWLNIPLADVYNRYYKDYANGSPETQKILQAFRDDDVMGIFQYEGGTTRQVVRQVQPDNFDELAACGALSRPGPYYGGQTRDYIKVKNGEMDWERIHPTGFDRHVEWTNGQIVYQEQIMWILRDLARFDIARVLRVRKIIGKKLGEFQFAELWAEFREGCASNGVSEDAARKVWSGITTAAGYAFNTAHAYSYALVAWWQMWFKLNHKTQFFASALAKNGDGKKEIPRRTSLLKDALEHKIAIMPPDPVSADVNWVPVFNLASPAIQPGLLQMPDIGDATAKSIIEWRDAYQLTRKQAGERAHKIDWFDFMRVPGVGESTCEKLYNFSQKSDPFGIKATSKQLSAFRKQSANGEFVQFGLPGHDSFATSAELPDVDCRLAFVGLVANIVERDEVETIRQRTKQSIKDILAKMDAPDKTKKATIFAYDEYGEVALRVSRWRYDAMQAKISAITNDHHIVVGWGRYFADRAAAIQLEDIWVLNPD